MIRPLLIFGAVAFFVVDSVCETVGKQSPTLFFYIRRSLFKRSKLLGQSNRDNNPYLVGDFEASAAYNINHEGGTGTHFEESSCLECYFFQ